MSPGPLPEEFAPTGPKLTRFPLRPAPPVRARLFPDEARFVLRLALLVGGAELAAWTWLGHTAVAGDRKAGLFCLVVAALRLSRPCWARLGMRVSRAGLAAALVAVALLAQAVPGFTPGRVLERGGPLFLVALIALAALALGLLSFGDLAASCLSDAITVERRAAGLSQLEMAQGLGTALGLGLGASLPLEAVFVVGLGGAALSACGAPALRSRGTPRSSWPWRAYADALRGPAGGLGRALTLCAVAVGFGSGASLAGSILPADVQPPPAWLLAVVPLLGMALAARLDRLQRNALQSPAGLALLASASLALAAAGLCVPPSARHVAAPAACLLALLGLGAAASALPSAAARGAEMQRPLVSSWTWTVLVLGFGSGVAIAAAAGPVVLGGSP